MHTDQLQLLPGDNESGKTTLIAKLQGTEDPKKGAGLEYQYIGVKDEYRDGECIYLICWTKMGSWIKAAVALQNVLGYRHW